MTSQQLALIIDKIDAFPTLPTLVVKVMEIASDPESSSEDMKRVIEVDPSFTATILKMANSPFFGRARKVDSIQHALTVLGFSEVQNIILSRAVYNSFKNIKKGDFLDVREFWTHSFVCGLAAKIFANHMDLYGNEYFVAGLIHDIGKLVIYMTLPKEFERIVQSAGESGHKTYEAEKKVIGITHDEIGMKLLEQWHFPENLVTAIGFHHRLDRVKTRDIMPLIIHCSDLLAHLNQNAAADAEAENFVPGVDPETLMGAVIDSCRLFGRKISRMEIEEMNTELTEATSADTELLSMFIA